MADLAQRYSLEVIEGALVREYLDGLGLESKNETLLAVLALAPASTDHCREEMRRVMPRWDLSTVLTAFELAIPPEDRSVKGPSIPGASRRRRPLMLRRRVRRRHAAILPSMDLGELVLTAAPGAILGAVAGGLVAELRGRRAEAREDARRARDRVRERDLKRIADTRGQMHLNIAEVAAHHRGEVDRQAEINRELDRQPYPDNDFRILGDQGQAIMTELLRFSSLQGDQLDVMHASSDLEDLVWRVTGELRDRVERGEPLKPVDVTLEGSPDDVRRRFVPRSTRPSDLLDKPERIRAWSVGTLKKPVYRIAVVESEGCSAARRT